MSLPMIVIVALAIRAGFAWDFQAHSPHRALASIPFLFESGNIAYSLAQGHGFGSPLRIDTGPTAWMTPLYPLMLSAIMRIFGIYTFASWIAAVSMNIGFSSLTCIPLFLAGKRVGGLRVAALAAWLWAVFPNAIQLSFQSLWDTSLSALLGAIALWATLRLEHSTSARDWTAYGLLWGIILMTNAAMLSLLPLYLGWLVYRRRANMRNAAIACAATALCCLPWTVRNYSVFGSFVPLRSTLGLQLWVGNNPAARPIWLGDHHPINDRAEREQYISLGEIPYMAAKRKDAVGYMLTHPAHELKLIAGRFTMFWSGGSPHPLDDWLSSPSWWFRLVLGFNIAAALGTLAGVAILVRKRSLYAFPLAAGPAIFPFAYYLTLALPRYRHPIDATLMLLMAMTLAGLPSPKHGRM